MCQPIWVFVTEGVGWVDAVFLILLLFLPISDIDYIVREGVSWPPDPSISQGLMLLLLFLLLFLVHLLLHSGKVPIFYTH